MISAAYDGVESQVAPPLRYILHRWRREMHQSYADMRVTPLDVIRSDLEYINIERTIRAEKMNRHA